MVAHEEALAGLAAEEAGGRDDGAAADGAAVAEDDAAAAEAVDEAALFEVQIAAGAHVARVVDADVAVAEDEAAGGAEAGAQQRASAQPAADHPAQLQHVRRAPLVQRAGVAAAPVGDEAAERVDVGLHERPLASLVASCS